MTGVPVRSAVTLRVVGAALGRTGAYSLKLALERLLGGRRHHMAEVVADPERIADGWAPLCNRLGRPVPNEPLPGPTPLRSSGPATS